MQGNSWSTYWVGRYITHLRHVSYLLVMMSMTNIAILGSESPPYPDDDSIIIFLSSNPSLVFTYFEKKKDSPYFLEDF